MAGADHSESGMWLAARHFDPVAGWEALLARARGVSERLDEIESDRPPPVTGDEDTLDSH